MFKSIAFAAVAASVLSLHSGSVLAQATPVAASPAQARAADLAPVSKPRLDRMMRDARGFEAHAAAPAPLSVWNKHTANISSY